MYYGQIFKYFRKYFKPASLICMRMYNFGNTDLLF